MEHDPDQDARLRGPALLEAARLRIEDEERWMPGSTAPRDGSTVRLRFEMGSTTVETHGWWLPHMEAWTCGGTSLFEAVAWRAL